MNPCAVQAGEYVVNHQSKTAFLIPHTPAATHEATVATSLLSVDGAANITFDGLSFRGARGACVVIRNSTGIVISNGGITDCGMSAFNVTGGSNCGLLNVDVVRCGTGGAVLDGGDRQTLTEANHFVRESRLRDSNRWVMNYAPLVLMAGVGQRVEGSVLSDAPQTAVFVQGNSHKLLNSTIRDVVQQCDDVCRPPIPCTHVPACLPILYYLTPCDAYAVWGVLLWARLDIQRDANSWLHV